MTLFRVFAAGAAMLVANSVQADSCSENVVHLRGDFGQARFTVEVADEPAERAQGLMFREHLPQGQGMLFLYDTPHTVAFWMRNTLIPLDILFLDAQGRVQAIHENAEPLNETPINGGSAIIAVLEINGGLSQRLGLEPGSQLRHPFFGSSAAWPCDAR